MQDDKGILLESGTNEFEIIEFTVDGKFYGINVAKVREIINNVKVTHLVGSHPYIEGLFTLRDKIIPLVDLTRCLTGVKQATDNQQIIVCEINGEMISFRVDEVTRIYRVSWTQMEPLSDIAGSDFAVGVVKLEEKIIVLIDFEKIISEIDPTMNKRLSTIPAVAEEMDDLRKTKTILIAEDSRVLRELLIRTLSAAGYHVVPNDNGLEAWDSLNKMIADGSSIEDKVQLVITDIEMPQMDGHHLIKKIKEDDKLKELPVIIFSSMISEELRRKGQSLGAYAQITKPEIEQLIVLVDKILLS